MNEWINKWWKDNFKRLRINNKDMMRPAVEGWFFDPYWVRQGDRSLLGRPAAMLSHYRHTKNQNYPLRSAQISLKTLAVQDTNTRERGLMGNRVLTWVTLTNPGSDWRPVSCLGFFCNWRAMQDPGQGDITVLGQTTTGVSTTLWYMNTLKKSSHFWYTEVKMVAQWVLNDAA